MVSIFWYVVIGVTVAEMINSLHGDDNKYGWGFRFFMVVLITISWPSWLGRYLAGIVRSL